MRAENALVPGGSLPSRIPQTAAPVFSSFRPWYGDRQVPGGHKKSNVRKSRVSRGSESDAELIAMRLLQTCVR
jgi:hypothetical protein